MIPLLVFAWLLTFAQSEKLEAEGVKWWRTVATSTTELHNQTKMFCDIFDHDSGIFNSNSSLSLKDNTLKLTVTTAFSTDRTKELALSFSFNSQKNHYNRVGMKDLITIKSASLSMKVKRHNQSGLDLVYQNDKDSSLKYEIFYKNGKELTLISSELKLTLYFIGTTSFEWPRSNFRNLSWIKTSNTSQNKMSYETVLLDTMFNSSKGQYNIVSYKFNSDWFKLMVSDGSKSTFNKQLYIYFQYSQTQAHYKGGKKVNYTMQNATLYLKYQTRSDETSEQAITSELSYSLQYVVNQKLKIRSKQLTLQLEFSFFSIDQQYGFLFLLKILQLIVLILIAVQFINFGQTQAFQQQSKPFELLTLSIFRALIIEMYYLIEIKPSFQAAVVLSIHVLLIMICCFNSVYTLVPIFKLPFSTSIKIIGIAVVLGLSDQFQALLAVTALNIYLMVSDRQITSRYTFRDKLKRTGPTVCIMVFLMLLMIEKQVHSWREGYDYDEMTIAICITTDTAWLIFANGMIYLLSLAKMEEKFGRICLVYYYAVKFWIQSNVEDSQNKTPPEKRGQQAEDEENNLMCRKI